MLIKTKETLPEKILRKISCKMDSENDVEFKELYGWDVEFIGELKPCPILGEHVYSFSLDRIERNQRIGQIQCMKAFIPEERNLMIIALNHDYGMQYTIIDKNIRKEKENDRNG